MIPSDVVMAQASIPSGREVEVVEDFDRLGVPRGAGGWADAVAAAGGAGVITASVGYNRM